MEMRETYRRTNITATLHQSGLDGKVTKLKLLLSKETWNPDWNLQKYTQITLTMKKKKHSLVWWASIPYSCLRETKHQFIITWIILYQRWSTACGGVFQRQGLGKWSEKTESWMQLNTEISIMKTWFRALKTADWAESSPSNMTITLRTQPRQCRSGLGTTLWTSSSGPATAGTWNQSDFFRETYKCLSTGGTQPTWQSFRWSKEKKVKN